jgi:hypothetical protein
VKLAPVVGGGDLDGRHDVDAACAGGAGEADAGRGVVVGDGDDVEAGSACLADESIRTERTIGREGMEVEIDFHVPCVVAVA